MRDDMFKVIVERPRRVHSNAYKKDGRVFRNNEERPAVLGMKKGYSDRKWLNENLAPLKRYLHKQVNRPWDKVYGEIRASIDSRSTVKQHILQHLDDFVAIQTRWEEGSGRVMVRESSWFGRYVPLETSREELFVHPLTGILLRNRRYTSWQKREADKRLASKQMKMATRRIISERVQLHCIEGVWYEITLDSLPDARKVAKDVNGVTRYEIVYGKRWDVVRKKWVEREFAMSPVSRGSNQDYYGCATLYALAKRQLNSKEIQKYRLDVSPEKQKVRKGLLFFMLTGTNRGR